MTRGWSAAAVVLLAVAARAEDDGWETLAAKDLTGWVEEQHFFFKAKHPGASTWSVRDGVLLCDGSLGNCGFLRFDRRLGDFTLRLEYRLAKGCNTGVCFRSPRPYDGKPDDTLPSRIGYEVQVLDDAGKPASKTSSGAFYGRLAPGSNAARPAGEWNTLEIACKGPRIRVTLNGKVVQDVDQTAEEAIRDRPQSGYLLLQNHGGRCEFRNLRLREEKR